MHPFAAPVRLNINLRDGVPLRAREALFKRTPATSGELGGVARRDDDDKDGKSEAATAFVFSCPVFNIPPPVSVVLADRSRSFVYGAELI